MGKWMVKKCVSMGKVRKNILIFCFIHQNIILLQKNQ